MPRTVTTRASPFDSVAAPAADNVDEGFGAFDAVAADEVAAAPVTDPDEGFAAFDTALRP